MLEELKTSKEYRNAFLEEAIRSRITAQITALRKERGWDLKAFAGQINKKTSWAYRLEDPNSAAPTVPSLLEVAEAFDVGLDVRFCPFSELLEDVTTLGPDSFRVPSFGEELKTRMFRPKRRNRKGIKLVHSGKSRQFLRHSRGAKKRSNSTGRKPPQMEPSVPLEQWASSTNRIANQGGR